MHQYLLHAPYFLRSVQCHYNSRVWQRAQHQRCHSNRLLLVSQTKRHEFLQTQWCFVSFLALLSAALLCNTGETIT